MRVLLSIYVCETQEMGKQLFLLNIGLCTILCGALTAAEKHIKKIALLVMHPRLLIYSFGYSSQH